MSTPLSAAAIASQLTALPGWSLNQQGALSRTFKQPNFLAGLIFVTQITSLTEAADHHPDVLLTYPAVTIMLITHDAGGLTEKDFALAKQIDALA